MIQMYHLPEGPGIELGQEKKEAGKKVCFTNTETSELISVFVKQSEMK
jgi:hypothetical protein